MYDTIIIGSGPAGMTSAIYLARANKKVLIIEKDTIGGQISSSPLVENYPGYIKISGSELANNMYEQVISLGVDIFIEKVVKIEAGNKKKVFTEEKNIYEASCIIIATGVKHRLLGLTNEENLIGNGIHFCVACDGAFYKNKIVAVIGGGNSAIVNALALCDICKKVYIIQNLTDLTAENTLQNRLKKIDNVEIIFSSVVKELIGEDTLKGIIIKNNDTKKQIDLDGIFLSIGLIPQNEIFKNVIDLDKYDYINSFDCKTNKEGIFVAGDTRTKNYRQITTAVNDGTVAAMLAIEYLKK